MGERYPALRYSDNMWEDCKNGILTVECDSWKELENRIEEYKEYAYLWRGQSCDKQLLPTIYRGHNIPNDENIKQHLNQFKKEMPSSDALMEFFYQARKNKTPDFEKALSDYYNMIHPKADANDPKENYVQDFIDNIFWAIGQHHGLKTPLLDWTKDPYKSLFFAFCEIKEDVDKRVIFGLAEKSRRLMEKNRQQKKRYIELLTSLNFVQKILESSDIPPDLKKMIRPMFDRINAQDGIFTHSLHIENVEKHTKRCYRHFKKHRNEEIVFLIKILVPNVIRKEFLKKLEEKKITYKTMFPDIEGASLYCNLKLKN